MKDAIVCTCRGDACMYEHDLTSRTTVSEKKMRSQIYPRLQHFDKNKNYLS